MRCPNCAGLLQPDPQIQRQIHDKVGGWKIYSGVCPACDQTMILLTAEASEKDPPHLETHESLKELYRQPLPPEVIETYAKDYDEACFVLTDSPRASAALSRSCLQRLLREKTEGKADDLSGQIAQAVASKSLPPETRSTLAAVTDVSNLEANPLKNTHPGLILDVEPGEAEYLLDVLEVLFDYYFVKPAELKYRPGTPTDEDMQAASNSQARARFVKRIVTYVSAAGRD